MGDTGSGGVDQERSDKAATAASLRRSTRRGRRGTGKTAELTLVQALEILQQSLLEYQKAGGVLAIRNLQANGMLAIVLANVWYCQHCSNLSAGICCQHCPEVNMQQQDERYWQRQVETNVD
jgi:hypothetical protein